jgi:L-methionine (R)-S-oxide reductase
MSESIIIQGNSRKEQYSSLLPQLKALVEDETDQLAALGNIMSALKYGMNFFWVGIYAVKNNELVLGPFQGLVACTRIAFGKGVCGHCWKEKKTIIVEDVNTFSGHIACSSETNSEIVLPVFNKNKEVVMVLDVDSEHLAHFNETDKEYLEEVVHLIEKIITA